MLLRNNHIPKKLCYNLVNLQLAQISEGFYYVNISEILC